MISDALVCSLKPLASDTGTKMDVNCSVPCDLPAGCIFEDSVFEEVSQYRVGIVWPDGDKRAIVVLNGDYTSQLDVGSPKGLCRFVRESGPWGDPWSERTQ